MASHSMKLPTGPKSKQMQKFAFADFDSNSDKAEDISRPRDNFQIDMVP